MHDSVELLETLGFTMPTPAYLVGVVLFSVIGMVVYARGRRHGRSRERWLGLALMLYPYVVPQTWLLYVVGAGLTAAAWIDRG